MYHEFLLLCGLIFFFSFYFLLEYENHRVRKFFIMGMYHEFLLLFGLIFVFDFFLLEYEIMIDIFKMYSWYICIVRFLMIVLLFGLIFLFIFLLELIWNFVMGVSFVFRFVLFDYEMIMIGVCMWCGLSICKCGVTSCNFWTLSR